ncbi:ribosomal protein L7/L12 [Myxococcota bacterium]|nr:ribosomal protein L7/L12 [Myxococcota bacterium]MBU1898910.1 ribosomal protein L7/L12 [Myxococcota bacterium]
MQHQASMYMIMLQRSGDKKIQLIKEIRAAFGYGLKEAKALVDKTPSALGPLPEPQAHALMEVLRGLPGVRFEASIIKKATMGEAVTEGVEVTEPQAVEVRLSAYDPARKIAAIKLIREATGLGLAEAKRLAESPLPVQIKASSAVAAAAFVEGLRAIGGAATLSGEGLRSGYALEIGAADHYQVIDALCRQLHLNTNEAQEAINQHKIDLESASEEMINQLDESLKRLGALLKKS